MAVMFSFSMKNQKGEYQNFTAAINDETNEYGQNVSIWKEQSKEERDSKAKKNYIGNGRVFWTDGKVELAKKKEDFDVPADF